MENDIRRNLWKENLDQIFLKMHRKVYILIISFLFLLFVGLSLQNHFLKEKSLAFTLGIFLSQATPMIIIYCIVVRIKDKRIGDIIFYVFVIFIDITTLILCYISRNDESQYTRHLYHFICYGVMLMNIKSDHNWKLFVIVITLKIIIVSCILIPYDFKGNLKNNIVMDFYMILFSFAMILTNKILKSFLFVNLEQLNNKNVALADKMKKILNALKDPVISLNLSENVIFFNTCLIQFILTNFDENEYNTNFLLNENSKNENSEEMINNLLNEYKFGETYLNNIIANSDDNSNNFSSEFKIRILILHKIFANLMLQVLSTQTCNTLTFFNLNKKYLLQISIQPQNDLS